MTPQSDIGARARAAITSRLPHMSQGEVATRVGMTPDALSRALNGKRAFAAIELAQLADHTGTDVHELITGTVDPHRPVFIARHTFDPATGSHNVPGQDADQRIHDDIDLAYRQAGELPRSQPIPASVEAVRAALGDGFVRPFADRIEERLRVDVVRIAELTTSYSFTSDGRLVIAVPAVGNWFWENWCLAHELGHLSARHHDVEHVPDAHEREADAFAAELLLPAADLEAIDWSSVSEPKLALHVWMYGVSTKALARRLTSLGITTGSALDRWAGQATQRLLRRHLHVVGSDHDEITRRMTSAAMRRFPLDLTEAHLRRIASGDLGKDTLAWMLQVPAATLDVDTPAPAPPADIGDLAAALGLTTSS